MRDYVILNNKSSIDIIGLLISELPPITKPAIRNTVEEIDGLDGDIITKLGYSAYDKVVSIGLYGNYDIDEVISFFNTEGNVVFSNEPDKYYKYQILEQIDFEKLLRFRTATVTFHVQPFKYSNVEKLKEYNVTGSNSLVIRNNGNIYSKPTLKIYGSGNIGIYLNNIQLFQISLGSEKYITINATDMNAYKDDVLKNRLVIGDYDNFKLNVGKNTISWTGTITKIEIENYSRWI